MNTSWSMKTSWNMNTNMNENWNASMNTSWNMNTLRSMNTSLSTVLLDALVYPVSLVTLRAPGQVVRYLRLSGGKVLGGEHFFLWGKTCVLDKKSL
jgi:hypothetical protein